MNGEILEAMKAERDRIDQAISILSGGETETRTNGKRRLSAAARLKISRAAKARWAKAKRAVRNRL
jgi:hypothetical protein